VKVVLIIIEENLPKMSDKNSSVVEIEIDDNDSSDDSSDEDRDKDMQSKHEIPFDSNFYKNNDKNDEELEVFSDLTTRTETMKSVQQKESKKYQSTQSSSPGLSLIDAMQNSVSEIEKGTNNRVADDRNNSQGTGDDPFFTSNPNVTVTDGVTKYSSRHASENSSSATTAAPTTSSNSESNDVFGIAYKPYLKKKEEYSMPKGVAFEDEAEFERELGTTHLLFVSFIF
jgi:hypothetical protein